jgi:CHAD domain-containing protein
MEPDYIKLKEIKPVLSSYIRESQIILNRAAVPDDKMIHDIRVYMKKSRAVLKLVAPQLDKEYIAGDIVALREIGRKMCLWRESSVLRKNLREFKKDFPEIFSQLADDEKINSMLKKPESVLEPTETVKEELEIIRGLLRKTGFRIRFQNMNKLDPNLLMNELELTYGKVADIYLTCRNNPKPDKIHEFRKCAKDFLYQLYFFRPLNPSAIKSLEKKLGNLTQSLGRFNDLTQLVMALNYEYSVNKYMPATNELVVRIREKQDRYLSKIWPVANKVFWPGQKLINIMGFKLLLI